MNSSLRFLLLQVRDAGDPMLQQEIGCFAVAIGCELDQITTINLLVGCPTDRDLDCADMVLLGGSGRYSATADAPWLDRTLASLRELHARGKPTFASCWGFQAMARALGGTVINDPSRAELGTHRVKLPDSGKRDPIFGPLGDVFEAQMGHEDRVAELPPDAVLLASTGLVQNQAFRFENLPIYCTQFHPELSVRDMIGRVCAYPEYVSRIAGLPPERFQELCWATPSASKILPRFIQQVFGD